MAYPTSFSADNQPVRKRGKLFKTLLMESLRANALIECNADDSNEEVERAFITKVASIALSGDPSANVLLKELVGRSYPSLKPVMQCVDFEFDRTGTISQQVAQIIHAASNNQIPPDVANLFVQTIKAAIDIDVAVDLKARIDALEALLNASP